MPPGYLCGVCKQTATSAQCLGERFGVSVIWGLCGDAAGLGQGHCIHHKEVWEVEVPTLCVCSGAQLMGFWSAQPWGLMAPSQIHGVDVVVVVVLLPCKATRPRGRGDGHSNSWGDGMEGGHLETCLLHLQPKEQLLQH